MARTPATRRPLAGALAVRPPEERRYRIACRELRTSAGAPFVWADPESPRARRLAHLFTVREVSGPVPRILRGSVRPVESTIMPGELAWALVYDLTDHYATAQAVGPELAGWLYDTMQPGQDVELTYEDLAPWLTLHLLETT